MLFHLAGAFSGCKVVNCKKAVTSYSYCSDDFNFVLSSSSQLINVQNVILMQNVLMDIASVAMVT